MAHTDDQEIERCRLEMAQAEMDLMKHGVLSEEAWSCLRRYIAAAIAHAQLQVANAISSSAVEPPEVP